MSLDPGPPPKLVVTDLDGTLLGPQGQVSARTAATVRRVLDAGVPVVVATGRPAWWLDPIRELGFTGTAICLNGAMVCDLGTESIVQTTQLRPEIMRTFVAALATRLPRFALAAERVAVEHPESWSEPGYEHPYDEAWEVGRFRELPRSDLIGTPAVKLLVRCDKDSESLAAVARDTGITDISITYSSNNGLIEVAAAGVDKGAAIDAVARRWGIGPADAIAFGDMPNDETMLSWAGRSYAMGNAHPLATAAATDVTAANTDDGVAQILERWF